MRTGVLASVMAVTCLALGTACSAPDREFEAPVPASPRTTVQAVGQESVPPCPSWEEDVVYPDGPLSAGAVSLRICPGDAPVARPPAWKQGIEPPADALVTGVADLVDEVNALPGWVDEPRTFCSQEGRPRIRYVFGYPDGSTSTITHGYGECHVLELAEPGDFPAEGDLFKPGAIQFRDMVADALLDQRRSMRPPYAFAPAPRCVPNVAPQSILPPDELDLAIAALCLLPDGRRYRRAELDSGLVARITDVLHRDAVEVEVDEDCHGLPFGKVVGRSTWGDMVQLDISQCAFEVWRDDVDGPAYLPLGADLVADLLAQPRGPWIKQR